MNNKKFAIYLQFTKLGIGHWHTPKQLFNIWWSAMKRPVNTSRIQFTKNLINSIKNGYAINKPQVIEFKMI